MDHRQRVLAAIRHQPVDRLPTDIWATVEVQEKLYAHLGIDIRARRRDRPERTVRRRGFPFEPRACWP